MPIPKKATPERQRLREFDRRMLRSSVASLFWAAIMDRRRRQEKMTFEMLANRLSRHKSAVSRWFSIFQPNWELDTVADIAGALDLDLRIEAYDRKTGAILTPSGPKQPEFRKRFESDTGSKSDQLPPPVNPSARGIWRSGRQAWKPDNR